MDMLNNKRSNGWAHARVTFSQSEKSLLPHGGVKILDITDDGGIKTKYPQNYP